MSSLCVCVCVSGLDPGWSRGMPSIKASGCWGRGVVLPWRDWKRRPAIICFSGSSWKRAEDTHTRDWPPPPARAALICYHHIPLPFCSFPPFSLNPHLSSLPGLGLLCLKPAPAFLIFLSPSFKTSVWFLHRRTSYKCTMWNFFQKTHYDCSPVALL